MRMIRMVESHRDIGRQLVGTSDQNLSGSARLGGWTQPIEGFIQLTSGNVCDHIYAIILDTIL